MPQANLLDIAKLNGSDTIVGLIEETLTYAPEVQILPARTIRGTSYKIASRVSYPGVGFRAANEGSTPTKSEFESQLIECYILSGAVQADVAVARAYEDGEQAWKDVESVGVMRQAMIELGSQVIYGTSVDSKGFPGLQAIHTAFNAGLVVEPLPRFTASTPTPRAFNSCSVLARPLNLVSGASKTLDLLRSILRTLQTLQLGWGCRSAASTAWAASKMRPLTRAPASPMPNWLSCSVNTQSAIVRITGS
jgi:hypothetical protein